MKYSLIIFDWDGTLMDSTPKIVSSMQNAAAQVGAEVPTAVAVNNIIGMSLRLAIETLFPTQDSQFVDALFEAYKNEYLFTNQTPSPLFDGTMALLNTLRSKQQRMAVATGKARQGLERVLTETGTQEYFEVTRCGDECRSKPDPQMLTEILNACQIPASQAVMIGDTPHDLNMARKIDMPCIGVSYGAQPASVLAECQPTAIVDNVSAILDWV